MGDFAAVVRRFMKARGMSLRATAKAAGYSDHTLLSKVLNGHKPVTPYMAACLDDTLGAEGAIVAAAEEIASRARLPLRELADHAAEFGQFAETGTAGPGTVAALEDEIAPHRA
jgi:plasmid maintenance system antidote protein VapI